MDNRTKMLIYAAASYMLISMLAVVVESRKRKRREHITYGPMFDRDRMRIEYLDNKIWKNDTTCINMLRLRREPFFRFCKLLRDRQLLQDTIHMCVEQQVAMFLNTVGHNLRNRLVATNFDRSGETVSRYFNLVLLAIGELRNELIRKPSMETPTKIQGNYRWDPYFQDCVGAIDGTHIRASITKAMEPAFYGRKSHASQNVMAAVDFDLRFTYVLAGWEGTAHDALVLRDALERPNGLRVPQGKYYLVDAGYGAKLGFLPPFRDVRYHLNEWGNNPVQNEKELFNFRHSSLRVTVERAFGSLKRRFKILDDATPFFRFPTQVDIVVACCIIHNWVLGDEIDEYIIPEDEWPPNINYASSSSGLAQEDAYMVNFRQGIADQMWQARENYIANNEMDVEGFKGDGQVCWTPPMSSFMLNHLFNLVAGGVRTSHGFKTVHLNACAKALNDHFKTTVTGA
ncbi:protein ALP1-like [Brachypodium distachyon]|uniref:protein ALP1-like n=1 Tax=Brachypodium distachyon TaxID=15368 RepID=UPI000D0CEA03|nr:protein ALP1-like [Brachypodium distachyon]|eukprot:XP_024311468.1 protein ALP1-like [Brachypodium distachyon]